MDRGSWRIAVLFAAAALGGTYLVGSEVLRFFAYFGFWGILGILLVSAGLGWLGIRLFTLSHEHGFRSLHDLLCYWFGEKIAPGLSVLLQLLLLAYIGTSIGGATSLLLDGSFKLLLALVPFLIACVFLRHGWPAMLRGLSAFLVIGLLLIATAFFEQPHITIPSLGYQLNLQWMLHAAFYFALHFLLILITCLPLASRASRVQSIHFGVIVGCLLFFLIGVWTQGVLLGYWHEIHSTDIPLQIVLISALPFGKWIHSLAVLGHGGLILAVWIYALATPVAVRYDIRLSALFVVMMITTALFSVLTALLPVTGYIVAIALTYCALFLVISFVWKLQKPQSPGR
ncbi:hypothetical protein NDK47_15955 [Brevibacillus ruminantium]|uniref:Uncharacterized protein n=1 Tax=Brevibacillus ruminantium TaxID=2950604 RepID=A0ABY4WBY2_9BACL|nr:hypothetical protein [Brevibacillus ruminantium]USG63668.1 hypothetical protein NDK47_15955 [Brevibacillus ruminantium]